jgi:peptidyl-prolyl cis-trans isomerase SurA
LKINYFKILFLSLFFLTALNIVHAQKEGDRIIAIVGNDIILESDLQYQMQMYARQNNVTSINPAIAQQIFQQMLTDKIILAKAEQDSVIVKDEEVNKELDFRLKSLIQQVGSEQRIQEVYGMPLVKIRLTLKEDLVKKMMSDKLKRKKFSNPVKVSDKEVRDFYNTYGDSLPPASEEFEMSHIFISRKLTDGEKQISKAKALQILDSVKAGTDFSELAKRNSDDKGSAVNGGDLGFAKKGVFVKEFEEALNKLSIGEVSDVVETEFGYHIIKLIEKKGDLLRAEHILVSFKKSADSDFGTIATLNGIRDSIQNGKLTFERAAVLYSQDVETNTKDGYIGFVPIEKLDSNYVSELNKLQIEEISKPLRSGDDNNYGYELIKIKSRTSPHKLTLETDFSKIKKYASAMKENKAYEEWIEELKKSVYVDTKF